MTRPLIPTLVLLALLGALRVGAVVECNEFTVSE